jgi:predicted nuclease of restriction endonuclease-like RecB superfamily
MLTGKLVRVRTTRDRVIPLWLNVTQAEWIAAAEQLLSIFRAHRGRSRGDLDEEIELEFGALPEQLIYRGLAKLLEDRCEFEVEARLPPEQIRDVVFRAAAAMRIAPAVDDILPQEDRGAILDRAATELGLAVEQVEQGLFADLKSEQRLVNFDDLTAQRLLERYNVGLAQAVLLRASAVEIRIRAEAPAKYRQLLRLVKFHRLVCEAERGGADEYVMKLDGPLSLFAATQKYGLQLALFLPAVLRCHDFDLAAALLWGPKRLPKAFTLTDKDGLVSHDADRGVYVPPELAMFAELFRKKIHDWEISEETELLPLGPGFWVPDFRLLHRGSGRVVYVDVLGYWRKSHAEKHLENLRRHARHPFVLALSEQLHIHDEELSSLTGAVHRFRQMPLPDEIARLAQAAMVG